MINERNGKFVTLKLVGSVRIIIMVGPDLFVLTEATSNSRCGASHGGGGACWPPPMKKAAAPAGGGGGGAGAWADNVATTASGIIAGRYRMTASLSMTL